MISRDHFPMIAQISNDGLTRVTYGEKGGLTYEEMLARQPEKYVVFCEDVRSRLTWTVGTKHSFLVLPSLKSILWSTSHHTKYINVSQNH